MSLRSWIIAGFIAVLAVPGGHAQTQLPSSLKEWHGEYFDKKQGGFFFSLDMKNFRGKNRMVTDVLVTVRDILGQKTFVVSADPSRDPSSVAGQIWATGRGKYQVESIVVVDGSGIKRTWSGSAMYRDFVVKRQCLSNLGRWTIAPEGRDSLKVVFSMVPNVFRENGKTKKDSSIAAVLDGFNGLVQEAFGGSRVLTGADTDYSSTHELRRSITFHRQIAMFYKLDLFRHNYNSKAISGVLNTNDVNLRRCYTDRLDFNDDLRGTLSFTFLLSKQTGTMIKLKNTGGTANDPKLVECVFLELSRMQFPVNENMIGELVYTYDVK